MKSKLLCFSFTTLFWLCAGLGYYSYKISTQQWILPNQIGYMEVRHNDLRATPSNFEVDKRDPLGELVREVSR
jgi:hypothetical protein